MRAVFQPASVSPPEAGWVSPNSSTGVLLTANGALVGYASTWLTDVHGSVAVILVAGGLLAYAAYLIGSGLLERRCRRRLRECC